VRTPLVGPARGAVGNPNHGHLYYRCRASRDFVRQHAIAHPPMLYVREDAIVGPVDQFLHEELGQRHLASTLQRIAEAQHRAAMAEHAADDQSARLRETIADAEAKISRYRAALDARG
jgi:site-specific DNA recombinase